jgi:hypothetical protein
MKIKRWTGAAGASSWLAFPLVSLGVLVGACGGKVVSSTGGTTGTSNGGATSTTTGISNGGETTVCECCQGNCDTATSTVGVGGAGGAGGGAICGGLAGSSCPPGDYCDYPDKMCGGNDGEGTCTPAPLGCPDIYEPVCGCDHQVYGNSCAADAAGSDVDDLGGCTPPPGMFGCGANFCELASQYCEIVGPGVEGGTTSYTCQQLPAGCGAPPSCGCLTNVTCGGDCMTTVDDGLEVICQVE